MGSLEIYDLLSCSLSSCALDPSVSASQLYLILGFQGLSFQAFFSCVRMRAPKDNLDTHRSDLGGKSPLTADGGLPGPLGSHSHAVRSSGALQKHPASVWQWPSGSERVKAVTDQSPHTCGQAWSEEEAERGETGSDPSVPSPSFPIAWS